MHFGDNLWRRETRCHSLWLLTLDRLFCIIPTSGLVLIPPTPMGLERLFCATQGSRVGHLAWWYISLTNPHLCLQLRPRHWCFSVLSFDSHLTEMVTKLLSFWRLPCCCHETVACVRPDKAFIESTGHGGCLNAYQSSSRPAPSLYSLGWFLILRQGQRNQMRYDQLTVTGSQPVHHHSLCGDALHRFVLETGWKKPPFLDTMPLNYKEGIIPWSRYL